MLKDLYYSYKYNIMTDQKIYWEMCFTLIALFFTVYIVAKDAVSNPVDTYKALFFAVIFWFILFLALFLNQRK